MTVTRRPKSSSRNHLTDTAISLPRGRWGSTALWCAVALTVVILPCTVSIAGRDEFRAPKEFILRGGAIVIGAILVLGFMLGQAAFHDVTRRARTIVWLVAAVVLWTIVTTALSVNPFLSVWSLVYVCACALFFFGALIALADREIAAVYVFLGPALVNVFVLVLQELRLWDFYALESASNRTALIGNPNDTGAYLLAPSIAAAVLIGTGPTRRALHIVVAVFLATGIFLTQSMTAIGAYLVAVVLMAATRSWKRTAVALMILACSTAVMVAIYQPLQARINRVQSALAARDYHTLTSFRLTAMVTAIEMFKSRPVIGVGPGCYGWRYFEEKIAAEARHPYLAASGEREAMFGEAHSDYLQILAVTGIPGISLLIVTILALASYSFRRDSMTITTVRKNFARAYSLPLAAGTAVLMIAQFPLELAASATAILFGAAICCSWSLIANR